MSRPLLDLDALVVELAALPPETLRPLADALAALVAPPAAAVSPWMTAPEAAEYLRCTPKRVYDLVGDGRLRKGGDGRRLLVRRSEVEALAESGQGAARPRRVDRGVDPPAAWPGVASMDHSRRGRKS